MEVEALAALANKMHFEDLKNTLASLWTVCAKESYHPLDRYVEGCGGSLSVGDDDGGTGTGVRLRFGEPRQRHTRQGKFWSAQ